MTTFLLASLLTIWQVDPYSAEKYLPDAAPAGGHETTVLEVASAKGEVTGLSFVVRPEKVLAKVDFRFSAAEGPDGATLPASAFDLYAVKCVYRPKGQWTDPGCGDRKTPELMNQMLLHDDALVRVDEARKVNFIRIDGVDGAYYADMGADGAKGEFNCSLQPVADAAAFVPLDLAAGHCRQFFVICRTPADAKAGDYRGTVEVRAGDAAVVRLSVEWKVYPFVLPRARTHYDTSREYMLGVYHHCHLWELLREGGDLAAAERKFSVVANSWREHNLLYPLGPGSLDGADASSPAYRGLVLMRRAGLPCRPLINGAAGDFQWACPPGVKEKPDPAKDPEGYARSLAGFREKVRRECATMDSLLGHHDCLYLAPDECGSETNRRLFDYWRILHAAGCSVYTDAGKAPDIAWMTDADNEPALIDHRAAQRWHAAGARCFSYAAPFTGPACPDIWRRTKGLRVWMSDYDGVIEYNFNEGVNRWNDFINHTNSGYNQFGLAFVTREGLVSTLAYEGLREGMNDVRYLSLMRLQAEAAMASADGKVRELGRRAIVWQDATDPEEVVDLDGFRGKVAAWIVRLQEATGRTPDDFTEGPAPELPPDPGKASPDRRDLAILRAAGIRRDATKTGAERAAAAIEEAKLLSGQLRRAEAVATLDSLLGETGFTGAEIAALQLAKAEALATPASFAESVSRARLDAAAAALLEALRRAVPGKERLGAVMRLGRSFLDAGEGGGATELARSLLRLKKLPELEQAALHAIAGRGLRLQGDREGAVRELRLASKLRRGPGEISLFCLEPLAELAEETKDWPLALDAYTELKGCYHPEYDTERPMVKFYENKIKQTMPKVSKATSPAKADFDDDGGISLDE